MIRRCFYFIFACFLLSVFACEKDQRPLRDYYFPTRHQVYIYSANDSIGKEYWEIIPTDEGLKTNVYSGSLTLTQTSVETFYKNGVNLEQLTLQGGDAKINAGFVFPFDQLDSSEVLFYHVLWNASDDQNTAYELIRNRRFAGLENREVMGKEVACAQFKLEERIISNLDGSIEMKTSGVEFYAEHIGLIYRRRQINEELLIEQILLDVITPSKFNALIKENE